jgi:hypothetical protein
VAGLPVPVPCWRPSQAAKLIEDYLTDRQRVEAALTEALADTKEAIELGPESADLYLNAARLCGFGTPRDSSLGELGLRYLARAIECGCRPQDLGCDMLLKMGLGHLPEFRRLVAQPSSGRPHLAGAFTVDPVPDAGN